ncbi:DUF748 domain-containing protein [Zooshikella harenae]|uniref:DUF748 domain-containing protein n=1 Tax=Zooshikella harenae TaxID=2827238 RepID=A0ABS5ZEZ0_9GAMM|nr:DUF748 domain-containing protein [Zooshikella harenae]MBU2712639.1 DUF748 domain-containing protein [Zooshikella harenae]
MVENTEQKKDRPFFRRGRRCLLILGGIYGSYAAIVGLVIPYFASDLMSWLLADKPDYQVKLNKLAINPFTLQVSAHDVSLIYQPNAKVKPVKQAGFETLDFNFDIWPLVLGQINMPSFSVQQPYALVDINASGQLNWLRLAPENTSSQEEKRSTSVNKNTGENTTALPNVLIDTITLTNGKVVFRDQRLKQGKDIIIDDIGLSVTNVSTQTGQSTALSLSSKLNSGGQVTVSGEADIAEQHVKFQSQGKAISIGFVQPWLSSLGSNLNINKGKLNWDANINWNPQTGLTTKVKKVAVQDIAVATTAAWSASLSEAVVQDLELVLSKQRLSIPNIQLTGPALRLTLGQDGQPKDLPFFPASSETPAETVPWQWQVSDIQLVNGSLHLQNQQLTPAVDHEVRLTSVAIKGVSSDFSKPISVSINSQVMPSGDVSATGELNLKSGVTNLQLSVGKLGLTSASPYIKAKRLKVNRGELGSELRISGNLQQPDAWKVQGTLVVSDLQLVNLKNQPLLSWQSLQGDQLNFSMQPLGLTINELALTNPFIDMQINRQRKLNFLQLASGDQQEPANDKNKNAAVKKTDFAFSLQRLTITNGKMHFSDESLVRKFVSDVEKLSGHIGPIDTKQAKLAKIDLSGQVEKQSPVSISGEFFPLNFNQQANLKMHFERLPLRSLTPYSGQFVGYAIKSGSLQADLHYRVKKSQLVANNRFVIKQLTLGEKVKSPEAVDVPLKLGIALLKDSRGNIDLDLPVKGNLSEPDISYGGLILKALFSNITKVVTSPFTALAGLLPEGSEDIQQLSFKPGSYEISSEFQDHLHQLVKALQERPKLQLTITGQAHELLDSKAIAYQLLEQQLQQVYLKQNPKLAKTLGKEAFELTTLQRQKALTELYEMWLDQRRIKPLTKQVIQDSTQLAEQLVVKIPVPPITIRALAERRAQAIADFLVDQYGLAKERVALLEVNTLLKPDKDNTIPTLLGLQVLGEKQGN